MTKVTVFNPKQKERVKPKQKIQFVYYVNGYGEKIKPLMEPHEYDEVCLLGKPFVGGFSWIVAWKNDSHFKYLYLSHWNDGVV